MSTVTPPDLGLAAAFPPTSRYHAVGTARHVLPGGGEVVHLRRRFIPPPDRFHVLHEHLVIEGERHDTLAAQLLGDPEQFWRLCDANAVLFPEELTETPGRRVKVTLPEGVPGTPSA
jgi:hypothetical protein